MILSIVDVDVVFVMFFIEYIYWVELDGCNVISISELLMILYLMFGKGLFFIFKIIYLIFVFGKVE